MSDAFEFNDKGLTNLVKALKGELPKVKVGILGNGSSRPDKASNAGIGRNHEFGLGVPQRSFLRMPINEHFQSALDSSDAFNPDVAKEVIRTASIRPWLMKVGIIAEEVIREAFATGGYGKWQKHKPGYQNNTGQILVDTQQLRNSITSEVE